MSKLIGKNISFSIHESSKQNIKSEPEVFNPKNYVMPGATEKDIMMFKEIFDILDMDDNGLLMPMEIRNAMIQVGYNARKQIIYQLLSDLDVDESGYIEFPEFVKLMVTKAGENDTVEEITKIFNEFDVEKKGYIIPEDLKRIIKEMREELTDEDIIEMIKIVDPKGEGKISLKAWVDFMRKPPHH